MVLMTCRGIEENNPANISDVEYTEPDNVRGNYEWPVTLPPKLLKDGFQIQPTKVTCNV